MVSSLAPNRNNSGSANIENSVVIKIDTTTSIVKLAVITSSAPALSLIPNFIEQRGAPPIPNSKLKAPTSIIIGKVTPTPAIATSPSSILPMYIRSIILYNRFTTCAIMAGIANFKSSEPTFSVPNFVIYLFKCYV